VILGKEDEASRLLRDLIATTTAVVELKAANTETLSRTPGTPSNDDPVTIGQLRTMLKEAF
jgi:hypothetical protein